MIALFYKHQGRREDTLPTTLNVQFLEPHHHLAELHHHLRVLHLQSLDAPTDLVQPGVEKAEVPSELVASLLRWGHASAGLPRCRSLLPLPLSGGDLRLRLRLGLLSAQLDW